MEGKCNIDGEWLCNQHAVQGYTLFCCQHHQGGLKDKPTKGADPYHTVYSLLGCSIAQHKSDYKTLFSKTPESQEFRAKFDGNYSTMHDGDDEADFEKTSLLGGILDNKLRRMHPIHSVRFDLLEKAKAFYRRI
jgi:prenyltransferase beta subunit